MNCFIPSHSARGVMGVRVVGARPGGLLYPTTGRAA